MGHPRTSAGDEAARNVASLQPARDLRSLASLFLSRAPLLRLSHWRGSGMQGRSAGSALLRCVSHSRIVINRRALFIAQKRTRTYNHSGGRAFLPRMDNLMAPFTGKTRANCDHRRRFSRFHETANAIVRREEATATLRFLRTKFRASFVKSSL